MTVVQHTVRNPAGIAIPRAQVSIRLNVGVGYTTDGDIVGAYTTTADDTGHYSVDLPANTTITPAGTVYEVTESTSAVDASHTISVPAAGGPYNLPALLVGAPTPPASLYLATTQKGAPSGVASLDASGYLPAAQLPPAVLLRVTAPSGSAATDTANIQTALDAAYAAGAGVVQLQPGTYLIQAPGSPSSGGVRVQDRVELAGAGRGVTTLKVADGTSAPITGVVRTPNGAQTGYATIRDLTIDGNSANLTGAPAITGFYCGPAPNSTQTVTDITLVNVEVKGCTQYGFDPHERTTRLKMIGCLAHNNGTDGTHDGFTLDGCYDAQLIGCVSYANGRHGFNLVTASARVQLIGCEAYGNSGSGYVLQNGAKDNVLIGCLARSNTLDGILVNGLPQVGQQDNAPGTNNSVKGCTVELSGAHGIHLVGASGNHVSGCTVRDSSQTTTNTSAQIYLDESGTTYSTGNTVINNDMSVTAGVANAPKYGLREATANDDNNVCLGNRSQGAVTAQISLQGTNSTALSAHNTSNEHPFRTPYVSGTPAEHGLLEWNFDVDMTGAGGGANGNAGVVNLFKIKRQSSAPFSKIRVVVGTAGSGLTAGQCFAAVFDSGGNQLGVTGDLSGVLNSTGVKDLALGGTVSSTKAGDDLYIALLTNGTTQPSYVRSGSTGATGPNMGFSAGAGNLKYATYGAALTAMPGALVMANMLATNALTIWAGLL